MSLQATDRPRVFVVQPIPERPLANLREIADVEMFPHIDRRATRAELVDGISRAQVIFALGENPIDGEMMDASPDLKLIAVMEIFPVQIDLDAATARGIPVSGLPHSDEITDTTAEYAMALISAVTWGIPRADAFLRAGKWVQYQTVALPVRRLRGKRLGIVGLGKIGRGLAERAKANKMEIIYHDLNRLDLETERALGVEWSELKALFENSDFVALCTTLTRETVNLVGADLIDRMRPSAVLINTSRGPILDESALADALEEGRLAAAGLDVYRHEIPDPDPGPEDRRLLGMDNVVLTPHIGTSALETREWMAQHVVDNIAAHIHGRRPDPLLNPEVYGLEALSTQRIG